jgi:hypothetical protein
MPLQEKFRVQLYVEEKPLPEYRKYVEMGEGVPTVWVWVPSVEGKVCGHYSAI